MLNEFITALGISVGAMFPIINPVGHAPIFYAMTQDDTPAFRRRMASKTSLYTFLILLVSLLLGNTILRFFGITIDDLRIAGGLLVARTAWNMLGNASRVTQAEHEAAVDKEDISLTPMATPILSGPGAMSLAIGLLSYGATSLAVAGYIAGFLVIGLMTWICLRYAEDLVRLISVNGVGALNRILGLLILAIGVALVAQGVKSMLLPR
jgi:MarC family membrane protein